MDYTAASEHIIAWLSAYAAQSGTQGFVVGISGGIDSALTSTLCALTGKPVVLLEMPIHQAASQVSRAQEHIAWLKQNFPLVSDARVDLTPTYELMMQSMGAQAKDDHLQQLTTANTRARLRMTTLYYYAGIHRMLVAGTGNKVEDFGVGFYTKYGDGGVDISPIADCYKTEVWQMGRELGVLEDIVNAAPTDGLWDDGRTDQDQLGGLSYAELELAMSLDESGTVPADLKQHNLLTQYRKIRSRSLHKMMPIPVFKKS